MRTTTLKLINNRKGNGSDERPTPVELRVTYARRVKYIPTGVSVTPRQWQGERVVRHPEAMTLNAKLLKLLGQVTRIVRDMELDEEFVDVYAIPDRLRAGSGLTFWQYVEERTEAKQVRESTRRRFPVFLNKIREYKMFRYFKDITESNIRKFDERLHAEGYAQSTVHCYHKYVKEFVNDAVCDGLMKSNPYNVKRIRIGKSESGMEHYLTMEELNRVEGLELSASLSRVRDVFVFSCYTGLAWSDMAAFSRECVREEDGMLVASGHRVKTGEEYYFVLLPKAEEVLRRYGWVLPVISQQKYNAYLKVVMQYAGIDKRVTSHWARHTAAMYLLNSGLPIEVVARVLGHADIRTTQKVYARIAQATVVREMSKLR